MRVRLEPEDEYMHEVGPESTFNESMYANVCDPSSMVGAFFRVGNRPNERRGEMTVCLYLPGGRVGFMFQRPEVTSNEAFDAAGLRFAVLEPFEHLTTSYEGEVLLLDDPMLLADPRAAFTTAPRVPCRVQIDHTRISDMFGGEPEESHERPGEEFAKGHYEQLVAGDGTIEVGDEVFEVHGAGLRDHSWGPRTWQAPWYYRWLTGNIGREAGFMVSRIARRDADGMRGGFFWDGEHLHACDGATLSTTWDDASSHQREVHATLSCSRPADGGDPRSWDITGRVRTVVPLRNRRDGQVTRIAEGLTEWTLDDGRTGTGWSEYLDQIIDDAPVGLAE